MKFPYFTLVGFAFLLLTSCKKECDPSTAEGAVFCWCEAVEERLNATFKQDSVGVMHARIRLEELHVEIEGYLKKGFFSPKEYQDELRKTGCALSESL